MRDALSPGFANAPEILERELPRKLDELVRWLDGLDQRDLTRSFSGRFWASRPQLLTGQLQQVLMLDSLEDDSVIRRRRGATCALESKDDELVMVLGDRRLFMPVRLRSAVEHIMEHSELRVADLGAHLNPESRLVLVRRLIKEGFLEQRLHD
jgi:hypothetical protein